jgi:DNA-binding transcriptional ArsR family regulator
MDLTDAATCLEKLGNPVRLAIVRRLVRAGDDGMTVGEIQRHLGIPASTLSHHLLHLVGARLVNRERVGRTIRCRAAYGRLDALVALLTEECCLDVGGHEANHRAD